MTDNIKLPKHSKHDFGYEFDHGIAPNVEAYAEAYAAEAVRLNAAPVADGMVLVERGALNMVINALRRDAEDGRAVRGEMADMLAAATEPQGVPEPAAHPQQSGAAQPAKQVVPEPIYQYRLDNGSWVDQARDSYEYNRANGVKGLRVVYETIPPAQPEQERKPLSVEQINQMRSEAKADPRCEQEHWYVLLARAIEDHHGIKGE